jgi:hypothetical protein
MDLWYPATAMGTKRSVSERRLRLLVRLVLAVVAAGCAAVTLACSKDHPRTAAQGTPAPSVPGAPSGYLLTEQDRVEFIQWIEANGQLSGQIQTVYLADSSTFNVLTQNFPFTGTRSGSSVSLSVDQGGHSSVTWTGALAGGTLTLVSPSTSGLLQTTAFRQATVEEYNQATIAFKNAVAARAAVVAADNALSAALGTLRTDAATLATDTRFADATKGFDPDWAAIQAALKSEQDAGQQPFDCGRLSDVQTNRATVKQTLTRLQSDDTDLTTAARRVATDIDTVKTDVATVQADLKTLQTASQNPVAAQVTVHNSADAVAGLVSAAQSQIDTSQTAMQSAQSQYGSYLSKAQAIDSQADQLATSLSCPTPTPQPAVAFSRFATVAGDWYVVDTIQQGPYAGEQFAFHLALQQSGTAISGSGDGITLSGSIQGSTVTASYQQTNGSFGTFQWHIDSSNTYVSGTFDNSSGNAGASIGQRTPNPATTVTLFYTYLANKQYQEAYALLSGGAQARAPYASWVQGYATTQSVDILSVTDVGSLPGQVSVRVAAVDRINGQLVRRVYQGTWSLQTEGSAWRLDSAQIRQVQ